MGIKSNCYISCCLLTIKEAFGFNTKDLMMVMLCDKHQIDVYLDDQIDTDYPINEERLGVIYRLALQADDEFDGLEEKFNGKELFNGISAFQLLQNQAIDEEAIEKMISTKLKSIKPIEKGIFSKLASLVGAE